MDDGRVHHFEAGAGRVVLVVVAHADDMTLFVGGAIAAWADAGWRVVVVRVTDDRWDSLGLDEGATVAANTAQLGEAARILGVSEVVELGYPTDTLADVSLVDLRQHLIRQIRHFRPYAVVTFDPCSPFGETNQDHLRVAAATDEATWTAQFDKHHPEHFAEGLEPHGCFEQWYFAHQLERVTHVVDISAQLERKIEAAAAHREMMANVLNQLRLQARTGGWAIPAVDDALAAGDPAPLTRVFVRMLSEQAGQPHGVGAAEEFRVVRFGGLMPLLEAFGTRLPDGPDG